MRRALCGVALLLAAVSGAYAAAGPQVIGVAKPAFPPAPARLEPSGSLGLTTVATTRREPSLGYSEAILIPPGLPRTLAGLSVSRSMIQPGASIVIYGTSVIAGFGPRGKLKYAFDLRSFGFPPKSLVPDAYGPQEVSWARQIGRTLVVQTNHLGYASDSGGRNGYLTGIDLDAGKVRWRSPALVANADNFVVVKGLIVSGYGFTAEKDWLYLVDPATGRVRDRLALPSMAERISAQGDRIVVRCYDAKVVARLA